MNLDENPDEFRAWYPASSSNVLWLVAAGDLLDLLLHPLHRCPSEWSGASFGRWEERRWSCNREEGEARQWFWNGDDGERGGGFAMEKRERRHGGFGMEMIERRGDGFAIEKRERRDSGF